MRCKVEAHNYAKCAYTVANNAKIHYTHTQPSPHTYNTYTHMHTHSYTHTTMQRWIVNGNIQCFRDLHLVIAVIAIVILALCVGIIPAILIYSCGVLEVGLHELTFYSLALQTSQVSIHGTLPTCDGLFGVLRRI